MLKGLFIPNSIPVKHKDFSRCCISEYHLGIKHVRHPDYLREYHISANLFKVADVYNISLLSAKQMHFVENDLLCVGYEFCMVGEVVHVSPFPGDLASEQEDWQQEEITYSCD